MRYMEPLTDLSRALDQLREEVEAGSVCGYHDRPMPCLECA